MEHFLIIYLILSTCLCLLSGLLSLVVRKNKSFHSVSLEVYHWCYATFFISGSCFSITNWQECSYLLFVTLFFYGLALLGYIYKKKNGNITILRTVFSGSYIGVTTIISFLLFSNGALPQLSYWFGPSLITMFVVCVFSLLLKRKDINLKEKSIS